MCISWANNNTTTARLYRGSFLAGGIHLALPQSWNCSIPEDLGSHKEKEIVAKFEESGLKHGGGKAPEESSKEGGCSLTLCLRLMNTNRVLVLACITYDVQWYTVGLVTVLDVIRAVLMKRWVPKEQAEKWESDRNKMRDWKAKREVKS